MSEVVAAPPKGLEMFAPPRRQKPLPAVALRRPPKGGDRAEALAKLDIHTLQDLLQHYPRRHIDRSRLQTVADLKELAARGELTGEVAVHARVLEMKPPIRTRPRPPKKPITIIKARIGDETGSIDVTWFNQQ